MKNFLILMLIVGNAAMASNLTDAEKEGKESSNISKVMPTTLEEYHIVSPSEPSSQQPCSYFYRLYKKAKIGFSNVEIEQNKFRDITVSDLRSFSEFKDWNELLGQKIFYSKGSLEGSSDSYRGYLIIKDFEYGDSTVKYTGPQKGFDQNVQWENRCKTMKPYLFIDKYFINDKESILSKGTPYEDHGNVGIAYVCYNDTLKQYMKVTVIRVPLP